jgi:hypothetical protein
MDRIAAEMGWGRTAVIRHLGNIFANPNMVKSETVRTLISRQKKFNGIS